MKCRFIHAASILAQYLVIHGEREKAEAIFILVDRLLSASPPRV